MMKSVFAFFVLLHLCVGSMSDMVLNSEIITRLSRLNDLFSSNKVALPNPMLLPNLSKTENLSSCVSYFVEELKQVLGNVTVHTDYQHTLKELKENLNLVDTQKRNLSRCQTKLRRKGLRPFQSYINFFRKLNNLKKK